MTSLCFSCPLPDCDEDSPRCPLRVASRTYRRFQNRNDLDGMPDLVRQGRNEQHEIWKLERAALRSEAGAL